MSEEYLGIIVSGGPAPGINSVIASVVIRAFQAGIKVKGFMQGFQGATYGGENMVRDLPVDLMSSIMDRGGSVLGTSRFNPFKNEAEKSRFIQHLNEQGIKKLVVIGGDGSAYLSYRLSQEYPDLQIGHVPKTIDNDLVLPNNHPSFGFETARHVGTKLVKTIAVDARTTRRWYIVTVMGRRSGSLALGLGVASGATLTVIPEEFPEGKVSLDEVAAIIYGSIKRRVSYGKTFGTAIIAEGLLDRLDPDSSEELKNCPRDDLGRIHYADIELERIIKRSVQQMCVKDGLSIQIGTRNFGYELRCYEPVSFDLEYTRFLGLGVVEFLLAGRTGFMVARDYDKLVSIPLSDMLDERGYIQSRSVDIRSDFYKVARSFMIR